jgi:predicted transcriptional regulator
LNSQKKARIRSFVQGWLVKSRVEIESSLEEAARLLELNEGILSDYEEGRKIPACYEMFRILKKYQIDMEKFAIELSLLQMSINLGHKGLQNEDNLV